jgi:ABC-2 type transport system permease protein
VIGAIAVVFAPLVAALALASVKAALVAGAGIVVTVASATLIQLCFRTQAPRNLFRHRHASSSRIATFAEAFSSIAWAATFALVVVGNWLALMLALFAITILGVVWLLSAPDTRTYAAR